MSNSFRVGAISAAMNFQTGGFMAGVRDVVAGAGTMKGGMMAAGAETAIASAAMTRNLKSVAAQAGMTSGALGAVGTSITAITTAANISIAGTIAKFVGLRSAAVAAARDLDNVNRANAVNRARLLNSDAIVTSGAGGGTGNEAAAIGALTARYGGLVATAGKVALGIGGVGIAAAVAARQMKVHADAALELEHSFAFVRKTVDGTKAELDAISDSLREMALEVPISVKELNGVAAAAGQLGIARENIVNFTSIMSEMGVASDMTAEQAAVGFAQWANITGMAVQDMDNLTSAVVHLGNNTATTESQILNMTLRLAGASRIVGVTDAEMAGLSASLSSLGIWAESGGNAMSRIMFDMNTAVASGSDELQLFAAVAGKTAAEFSRQFKAAPMAAITDFIGGLAATEKAGTDVTAVLESLGVTEMESRRALLGLAGGHEKLAQNIKESTQAFIDNNARSKEANTLSETGVSKIQLLKNATSELSVAVGENLTSSYTGLIATLTSAVNWTSQLISTTDSLRASISVTTGMLTGGIGRFLFGAATESGAERSIGRSHAINQAGFDKNKQNFMADIMGTSNKDAAKSLLVLQDSAKAATVDVGALNNSIKGTKAAMANLDPEVKALRGLVDSNNFKEDLSGFLKTVSDFPDQISDEMRSAKFADMWKSSHDGFKTVAEAAKLIPEEFRAEFIAAASTVETELAKKGKSGGRKLADEAGKEFEAAMKDAMQFRINLFPEEALAEEVRKVTKMAARFPEIMTGDAVAKSFDAILESFEGKGVNAAQAIKDNIIGIAPEFALAMQEAVDRANVTATEAMMEARAMAEDESHWSKEGDFQQRGKDQYVGLTDPFGMKVAQEDVQALTEYLKDLVNAGTITSFDSENILSLQYMQQVKDLASMTMSEISQNIQQLGSSAPPQIFTALKNLAKSNLKSIGKDIDKLGDSLKSLGAKSVGAAVSGIGKLVSTGLSLASTLKGIPAIFTAMETAGTSAAVKIGTKLHIALNVIALIADAIAIVISLFSSMGEEGKKELKGMALVIDEIKQASDAWIDSLTDKLVDAIKTGEFAWRDFVDEILTDITRIAIRELVVSPAVNFASGLLGFADGGAFSKGHVVDSPEYFNTKSGPAVRGEAGTEVVMPAVRLGDGTLGVKGMGGGGGSSVVVNVHDNRSANEPAVEVRQSTGRDRSAIIDVVVNAIKGRMIEGDFDNVIGAVQMRRGYA